MILSPYSKALNQKLHSVASPCMYVNMKEIKIPTILQSKTQLLESCIYEELLRFYFYLPKCISRLHN